MRKNTITIVMAAVLCVSALSGCQEAPEASNDAGILHARGTVEQSISDIAGENVEATPGGSQSGHYEGTIGTTDNRMKISADIPAIPANLYRITLQLNDDLNLGTLITFLESTGGQIEDTSQEMLEEIQKAEYDNTHNDDGLLLYSIFGDHSGLRITDGEREASFGNQTGATYVYYHLRDTYFANAQGTSTDIPVDQTDTGAAFSVREAERILLDKLVPLGITEFAYQRIVFTEGNGYSYYDIQLVPSYEGVAMISDAGGGHTVGEIYPHGGAIVTPEGVAYLLLSNFCGKIASREPVTVLSFEQVVKILEQYLDSNRIQADEQLTLSEIRLEYYPVPNPAPAEGEIAYRTELELIPIWHIYMPLDDYVESPYTPTEPVNHNICINAVTGELERVN